METFVMKTPLFVACLAGSILANAAIVDSASLHAAAPRTAPAPFVRPSPGDLALLRAQEPRGLESLRAGNVPVRGALEPTQRASLAAAEQRSTHLASLRAGDITSEDLGTILIIAAVIIVIALLL
jgi:hypothetical protein